MSLQRLVISNIPTGLETYLTPFNISNTSFPNLNNAYVWRGRVLRKRGDQLLGRLERELTSVSAGTYSTINGTNTLAIFTALGVHSSQPNAAVVPETLTIVFGAAISQSLTDTAGTGTLNVVGAGPIASASINYATGVVTIVGTSAVGPSTVTITVDYYPVLPVMGIEDFNIGTLPQPIPICFDTLYSYGFNQGLNEFYDVTFYKDSAVPFTWAGTNYEQFWTINYLGGTTTVINTGSATGCLWATNGNPGFHFLNATYVSGSGTMAINFTFTSSAVPFATLVVGDVLWFNEWSGGGVTINGVSGIVTAIVNAATGTYTVTFTANQTVSGTGIAQMMTNFLPGEDGIRWYDGDPTVSSSLGWVNFAPPLSKYDPSLNPNPTYLVGARMVLPFKNRLLFFGTYLSTTAASPGIQFFPNQIVYSQVGTPYYTLPLPHDLANVTPLPVDVTAWYQNVAGKGGFIAAPTDDQVITVAENEDLLLCIFETQPFKLIYTSDDTLPFIFQTVSAELGALSTFSGVKLDTGVLSVGTYGFTLCTSVSTQRIDLQIPDEAFGFSIVNNNPQRVCAVRDYQKEYVYFTYCPGTAENKVFPSKTLLYNYRENHWATFDENFTTYGTFRRTSSRNWSNIDQYYPTWEEWTDPWNFGANEAFFPVIAGGNQHGFVMQKGLSLAEDPAEIITAISGTTVTSPNHGLTTGDFIQISGMIGSTNLNGTTQQITVLSANTFSINDPAIGIYLGGGVYARIAVPFIQTKQFPVYWAQARGVRLGTSRFLFDTTPSGEVTVFIYSSQNANTPSNDPSISPFEFSTTVLTSAEPSLYSSAVPPYESQQAQIWHRMSTSINGDTIQLAVTLSDAQMFDNDINQQDVVLHAIAMDVYPGPTLAI
jgi:Ubiquitin-activating enzyme E1 FCCH domain